MQLFKFPIMSDYNILIFNGLGTFTDFFAVEFSPNSVGS